MAKFLDTRKAVSELHDLIRNAEATLILISPYLKLSDDFKELLTYRNKKDKITTMIFGKQELSPNEMEFLQGLRFVNLKYNQHLHAKCYVNDNKMIITSLNLYEFSMAHNKEMGVIIDKNDPSDLPLFSDSMKEVDFITETSVPFDIRISNASQSYHYEPKELNKKEPNKPTNIIPTGFCIRTGTKIPFNIEKPLSHDAFISWEKYRNPDFKEKYCHFSGEPSSGETSVSKPILKKNWKKAQEAHKF